MTGYMRRWACEVCSAGCESIDWPQEAICDRCERKRLRADEAQAVNFCAAIAMIRARDEEERAMTRLAQRVAERLGREAL